MSSTRTLDSDTRLALSAWLDEHLPGAGELEIEPIGVGQGTANVMMLLRRGEQEMVLRRPPARKVTDTAGSIAREARLLAALAGTDVPHAAYIAQCDDPSVIGSPFLLMERVRGYVPSDPLPQRFQGDNALRHAIGMEVVDGLAALATVDWRDVGLDGFGKPDGFLARQVDRWLWQLESYQQRELAGKDDVVAWLRDRLPEPGPVGIMHGDYSTFNVMFGDDEPARLRAIIDWDTATIGEVLMDFGHLLARWDEPGEPATTLGSSDIADRAGLASRRQLIDRYAERTGFDLSSIRYYEVLSLFKLSCIMEGQYASHVLHTPDGPMGPYTNIGPSLMSDALQIARGEVHADD